VEVPEHIPQPEDIVELRGNMPRATWDEGIALRRGKERNIWQTTIANMAASTEYKYAIVRSDGQLEWESGKNRIYAGSGDIEDIIRGFDGDILPRSTTVRLEVDLAGLTVNGYAIDQVAVMGERGQLSWDLPDGATAMTKQSEGRWAIDLTFPEGTPVDIPFKFTWQADGVWHWEALPGHIDHLLVVDPEAIEPVANYIYNPESVRVEAAAATGLQADNYAAAIATYGSSRRYGYFQAIDLLELGNFPGAREAYTTYRNDYDPVEIDDFDFLWASKLASQGQLDQALEFARAKMQQESNPWRRAYFQYLQGELLLNDGQPQAAVPHLEQALELAPDDDTARLVEGYSHLALALSYMQVDGPNDKLRARGHFMALANRHPDPQMKRRALKSIVSLNQEKGNDRTLERAYGRLIDTGSPSQRGRSRIDRLEHRMMHLPPDSVDFELQWLEGTIADEAQQQRIRLLKADHLLNQGRHGEAEQILEELQSRTEHPAASGRARARLNSLRSTKRGN